MKLLMSDDPKSEQALIIFILKDLYAPGISEALVATAIGLAVAVPATMGFNLFLGKLARIDTLLVNFAGIFLNRVQRELNAHRAVSRTGATEG